MKWKFDTVMVFGIKDGVWYKEWSSTFNCSTGKCALKFYDDDETTEVYFQTKMCGWSTSS